MSYDLMVFEPDAAPRDRKAFMAWYDALTEWSEGHDYNDPQFSSPRLKAWYEDMRREFPALNGPDAVGDDGIDSPYVTDYCFSRHATYVGFRWSVADKAYEATTTLAAKHNVGLFDVSADEGEIRFPS